MHISHNSQQIDLIFITGFLGAGKTTFLNKILNGAKNVNKGVIVNEFGEINVDSEIIEYDENTDVSEINNGSIFCSCLKGSFIKNILKYKNLPIDYLFVETSGLSQPSSVNNIINEIENQAQGVFKYRGMVAVADAANFLTLIQSAKAVQEQIVYSDYIIINKIDKVEQNTITAIEEKVNKLNEKAEIFHTSYGEIGKKIMKKLFANNLDINLELKEISCSDYKNPEVILLNFNRGLEKNTLLKHLKYIAEDTYRMKGFITTKQGPVNINAVGDDLSINPVKKITKPEGIIVFIKNEEKFRQKINELNIKQKVKIA